MASYKGTEIKGRTDQEVAAEVAAIDAAPPMPVNTMPAEALGQNPKPYSTYTPPPSAAVGLAETALSSKDALLAQQAEEAKVLEQEQLASRTQQKGLLEQIATAGRKRATLYEDEGVNDAKRSLTEITNEIESTTRGYDKRLLAIEQNKGGGFGTGVDLESGRINRQKALHLADLSIIQNARTRNFETAKSIVDQKVDTETEEARLRLEGLRYFYDENKTTLSETKRNALEDKIKAEEREYQEARDVRKQIGELQIAAATIGAPSSVVRAIGAAGTIEDAAVAGSGYLKEETGGSSTYKLTSTQRGQLLSGNFTGPEIDQLATDVATFGIEQATAGMEKAQADLVRRVFAGSDEVAGDTSEFLNADYFESLFTEDALKTAAAEAGFRTWYTGWASEKAKYLSHLEGIVKQYREAGYTDQEILKMMQ